ncbi:hypothetical protein SAMN05445850_7737 [Paraburkholderia tuberum]|uniref:Uncharacterized protein n=1 Tax=Paraburkholderia tuberum TaxID=157910 RepID=A0A1H1KGF9_9BURK|nr:hypothetical protein SAMN05445850_7737 [Paraburkholderia tuberum]
MLVLPVGDAKDATRSSQSRFAKSHLCYKAIISAEW